jgi:dTDP-4-dehydrorhamnose reductase
MPIPTFLPLLITGIAGVAGYNAFHYFSRRYPGQVIGTRRADNWKLSGDGIVACDSADYVAWRSLFRQYRFRGVLNCEGSCRLKSCELDPAMAWRVNVEGVRTLLDLAIENDVRFVHLSIDLVFSGSGDGEYIESDSTDPVTVYGETMVAAEELIQRCLQRACVLRISLPMGISFSGHAGAIDWIQSRFQHGRPATLYYDEIRTPTYTDCMNEVFEAVLANQLGGVHHAGGERRLSLFQIAQIVNRVGGYDPDLLQGCLRREAGPIPPRAGNVALDSRKLAQALGRPPFDPWPLSDEFVPTDDDWHCERSSAFQGSPELLGRILYRNPQKSFHTSP